MTSISNPPSPQALTPPRGAAIAGVIFAVLMIIGLGLTRYAIRADVTKPGTWLIDSAHRNAIQVALGVVPFAGIAFLWFIGVVRSRLGEQEDKFFASVFLGSGLLFVATLFGAAAITGALVESVAAGDISSATYYFGRSMSDLLLNLFAMKMAGVFMFSTCTLGLRTAIVPLWVVYTGYACSLLLLLVIANWRWITLVFPIWMLLLSTQILLAEFRSQDVRAVAAERHQAY